MEGAELIGDILYVIIEGGILIKDISEKKDAS